MSNVPIREDFVQPPQPVNVTHVYGLVLPPHVAFRVGKELMGSDEDDDEEDDDDFLRNQGYCQANLYCQMIFQDLPLEWREAVLGFVKGSPRPLIVFGHRNTKTGSMTIYVNPEQLERMRKTLGLGEDAPKWYKIAN